MPVAVIISQGVSGPTAGMGLRSLHWGPGSPQSSLRHLTLPLGRPGILSLSPAEAPPSNQVHSLSETRILETQDQALEH